MNNQDETKVEIALYDQHVVKINDKLEVAIKHTDDSYCVDLYRAYNETDEESEC